MMTLLRIIILEKNQNHQKIICKAPVKAPSLFSKKIFQPEGVVGIEEVIALITVISVHTVRIDHELEVLSGLMQCVQQLQGILVMYIIVTCAVCKL